jgi:hypothetical protein
MNTRRERRSDAETITSKNYRLKWEINNVLEPQIAHHEAALISLPPAVTFAPGDPAHGASPSYQRFKRSIWPFG